MLKHDITAWHCPVILLQLHGRALISAYATSAPLPCQSVSPLSPNMWRHNFLEDPCNISLHCSSTVKELPKVKLTLAGPEVNRLTLSALSQPRLPFLTSCPNFLHAAILRSKRWPWEPTCEVGHVITYSSNFHLLGIEAARFWWFYKKKNSLCMKEKHASFSVWHLCEHKSRSPGWTCHLRTGWLSSQQRGFRHR